MMNRLEGLANLTNNPRFAYDSYRRFIQMFSDVVLGVDIAYFEGYLERYKQEKGYKLDNEMTADDWKEVVREYKATVKKHTNNDFPSDPKEHYSSRSARGL